MKIVIQRVKYASVSVKGKTISSIDQGLLILLGVHKDDAEKDIAKIAGKVAKMRIMSDENNKMNKSIVDVYGSILVVSQFTLISDMKKGNRPSFIKAAKPEKAKKLYELFVKELLNQKVKRVEKGSFGNYMDVELINDGPVTIVL